jgi:hypothetical protein
MRNILSNFVRREGQAERLGTRGVARLAGGLPRGTLRLATFTLLFRARGGHAFHRLALRGGGDCGGAFSLCGGHLWVG